MIDFYKHYFNHNLIINNTDFSLPIYVEVMIYIKYVYLGEKYSVHKWSCKDIRVE